MINKILCIGPYKKPSNAYIRTVSFEALGYKVVRVNVNDNFSRSNLFFRIIRRVLLRPVYRKALVRRVKKTIRDCAPDLIFLEKGDDFSGHDLRSFKKILSPNSKIAHLNPDDPFGYFRGGWGKFISAIPYYDMHFIPKELNRVDYEGLGAKSVHLFDRSFDPIYHRPINLSASDLKDYQCDVGFIGSYAEKRESIIYEMLRHGVSVTIWGQDWYKGQHWGSLKKYWRGATQIGDDYIKAICGMTIALHFVRHENRDFQDSRTFEIPACGSFMLAERTPDHERLFLEDEEAVFFDSAEDCIAKCLYYLNEDEVRTRISVAGRQRVIDSNYDYISRSKAMLDLIAI